MAYANAKKAFEAIAALAEETAADGGDDCNSGGMDRRFPGLLAG